MDKKDSNFLSNKQNLTKEEFNSIVKEIQNDLNSSPFKFPNDETLQQGHFENGHYLHSNQYYFAKNYFQSSKNCEKLSKLLVNKLLELKVSNCTLIGLRSYIGLLLNITKNNFENLGIKINYEILEQLEENKFTWQNIPDFDELNPNFLIVLPVTCSCSTFIRVRKWLQTEIIQIKKNSAKRWRVKADFINIFLVKHTLLKNQAETYHVDNVYLSDVRPDTKKLDTTLSKLYGNFNWEYIELDKIIFRNSQSDNSTYNAHPLVNLYSDLYLSEYCPLCFPSSKRLIDEKKIFQTHNNFETPNLLLELPKFAFKVRLEKLLPAHKKHFNQLKKMLFTDLFYNEDISKQSLLYGYYKINGGNYLDYIRGNSFYQQNKSSILNFFDEIFDEILLNKNVKKIIFLTQKGNHNCFFLQDILVDKMLQYEVHILRYDHNIEFIDNFMSNHQELFKNEDKDTLIIYFQEVLSGAKSFKLLSDYIKHYTFDTDGQNKRHGFDFVFSLIDRTPVNTRKEILKKLLSDENNLPEKCMISFFHLNVPIIDSAHLGNPLMEKIKALKKIIGESHLDSLKILIGNKLQNKTGKDLPEESNTNFFPESPGIMFFPFEDQNEKITSALVNVYKKVLVAKKLDLLKLYASHQINLYLSKTKNPNNPHLISNIVGTIWNKTSSGEIFFTDELTSKNRLISAEKEIVHDTIIKILTRYPFTYYNKLYNAIFNYCLTEIELISDDILENGLFEFKKLRKFKFYIRCLIELDSSFLMSKKIFNILKYLYNSENKKQNVIEDMENKYNDTLNSLHSSHEIDLELKRLFECNLCYKLNQINSFFSFLLYCYKESVFKNHYRSIKLEELINLDENLPQILKEKETSEEDKLIEFFRDPYSLLIGMIKAENIYLLSKLKSLHVDKLNLFLQKKRQIEDEDDGSAVQRDKIQLLISKWLDPYDNESILSFYLRSWKSDPVILNAREFISKTTFKESPDEIEMSVSNMLRCVTLLKDGNLKGEFNEQIKEILQTIVSIIQPGIEDDLKPGEHGSKLGYALCIKYRNKSDENTNTDNIYVISSDRATNGAKLNNDGLIYNFMEGMYDYTERKPQSMAETNNSQDSAKSKSYSEQSLLIAIKLNNQYISFREKYYVCDQRGIVQDIDFNELYTKDLKTNLDGRGMPILDYSNMTLLFRLSELDSKKLDLGKCEIDGKAVLIITYSDPVSMENYKKFMNNEKVRLLLLIKEDVLEYLQKITDSDTFWELLKSTERIEYVSLMKHGIMTYFDSIKHILKNKELLSYNELLVVKLLNEILETQFKSLLFKINKEDNPRSTLDPTIRSFSEADIKDLFRAILEVPAITSLAIKEDEYDLYVSANDLKCAKAIYYHVIPELFINIRKQTFLIETRKYYRINYENNCLRIENSFDPELTPNPTKKKHNGGREMCKKLCNELNVKFSYETNSENNIYKVFLNFES